VLSNGTVHLALICATVIALALIGLAAFLAKACGWKITCTPPRKPPPPAEPVTEVAGLEIVSVNGERAS
jgi:hypothetical protein